MPSAVCLVVRCSCDEVMGNIDGEGAPDESRPMFHMSHISCVLEESQVIRCVCSHVFWLAPCQIDSVSQHRPTSHPPLMARRLSTLYHLRWIRF